MKREISHSLNQHFKLKILYEILVWLINSVLVHVSIEISASDAFLIAMVL